MHAIQIETEHGQQAATALRTTYEHALEIFISLLGAAIQAPDCVFGWLSRYKPGDLRLIVRGIMGSKSLHVRLPGQLTWQSLSSIVHRSLVLIDKTKEAEIKTRFASFWECLARNYLDNDQGKEYNCIKHGLRIQPGGFRLAFGLQERPGVPAPKERMQQIGGSKFGSTTLILERIGKNKLDYRVREYSRNWDLASFVGHVRIISMSINNVISFLRICNGQEPAKLQFFWPEDLADFDKISESECVVNTLSVSTNISEDDICPTRAEDVEKSFTLKEGNPAGEAS